MDERALVTTLIFFCPWKTLYLFACERKDLKSELSQNRTEKQIMLFKTTANWLFNDI